MSFELGVDANRRESLARRRNEKNYVQPQKRIDIAARPMAVEGRSAAHRLGLATRGLVAVHLVVFAALFVLPHQVRAQTDGICGRTATVRTAILAKIDGINDCGLVTSNHLAAITGVLSLNDQSIPALAAGDFDGLTSLVTLFLYNNSLTALPADVFDGLTLLHTLHLNDNELTTLPAGVFEPLTSLTDRLDLAGNPGAPFAPSAVALPDDGTVPSAGGTVMLDGSDSGGAWGAYVTYSWALTHPANGVTVVFDDPARAAPTVTIPPLLANTELTFTLTVTGRAGSFAGGVIPGTDTASVTGDATTANAPATGAPTISGTAKVSQTLTAATTGIADADGLTSPTYTYQWIRVNGDGMSNPADIPDATSSTYTLVTADLGKKIRVQVNFTDDDNHDEELTSAAYPASGTVAAAPTPNLTVGSPSVTNNNPEPGEVFTLSATVTNTGDKDAPATTLWFYQSTDTTITTSDPSPGTEPVGALAAGATSPESKDVTAPATAGTYYYGACVDPVPNETNTTNNCSQSVRVRVSARPNLTVDLPSVTDLTPETGGVLLLATTVTNRGSADADATTLRFYQSTDATITTSDTEVDTEPVGAPLTPATYYYGACVDPVPNERTTANNCSMAVTVSTNGGEDNDAPPAPPPPSPGGGGGGGGAPGGGPRQTVPDAPRNLLADATDGAVTLMWEVPEDDGGFAITGYEYRIDGEGEWISIGSTLTTHTVTSLVNGTEYTFQVRAPVTLLVANFSNGNDGAFNSRVYLWNPSTSAGQVTVRVFTLPLTTGIARELTGPPLDLGTLEARSALNLKLVEDILDPLEIALPYTTDGGNLTLEFTIQAADARGAAQVFSSDFAFGTYPMQEIPSTSSGSPTVLVANFMNGNDDAFNSRVYLWNPSLSAGSVTVRVFTLPLTAGVAQELTTAPLDLGPLGAESARNLKLAEDILTPLGIPTPYVTDGGNLTLEFTIQAADVREAAQVFSSSFAFGTVPLQVIQ